MDILIGLAQYFAIACGFGWVLNWFGSTHHPIPTERSWSVPPNMGEDNIFIPTKEPYDVV